MLMKYKLTKKKPFYCFSYEESWLSTVTDTRAKQSINMEPNHYVVEELNGVLDSMLSAA